MKAIGYADSLPITEKAALQDITLPDPVPGERDLLVEVQAVSVNPVDVKLRARVQPESGYKILGYDAAGIVRTVGSEVTLFKPGDPVFYAGAIDRPGTNSELHVVDERIVGRRPERFGAAEAAALPLTAITAWELLFDRLGVRLDGGAGETLLVIGGAGGVGSILIQIARHLTNLTVVATASRDESREWCLKMGAHHVIDHRQDIGTELTGLGLVPFYAAGLTASDTHFPAIIECLAPQGRFGLVDDPDPAAIDISLMKQKAISLHWEFMFTRSLYTTPDMIEQHRLLSRVADLADDGTLISTANRFFDRIDAAGLREAHALQESGRAIGKTVLKGF